MSITLVVKQRQILITYLADDTTLFLKDRSSQDDALAILKHFHQFAGLKLSKEKSESLLLDKTIGTKIFLQYLGVMHKIPDHPLSHN